MQEKQKQGISSVSSIDAPTVRTPPNDVEIEEAVLGLILLEFGKGAMDVAASHLTPETFYRDGHQHVYRAMQALYQKGKQIDILTIANALREQGVLDMIGGAYFLTRLTNAVVSSAHLEQYCLVLRQKHMRREMIRIGGEIYNQGFNEQEDVFDILDAAEQNVMQIGLQGHSSAASADTVLMETLTQIEKYRQYDSTVTGVPSGFPKLDRVTRGWQPGDLIILAARPSVGKTALALKLARSAAKNDIRSYPTAFWSLEMKRSRLMMRLLAAESHTLMHRLQTGRLDDDQMKLLHTDAVQLIAGMPLYFDDEPSLNIAHMRAKARRLKKKHNIGFIIVDYLQLMEGRGSNREQEISGISRGLKKLAMELEVPLIALSQLSREVEKRSGAKKVPQLSDLRESGAIEQDADMVLFLYGPTDEEVAQDAALETRRSLKIAKSRDGMLATITLEFQSEIQLFKEAALQEDQSNHQPAPPLPPGNFKPVKHLFNNDGGNNEPDPF